MKVRPQLVLVLALALALALVVALALVLAWPVVGVVAALALMLLALPPLLFQVHPLAQMRPLNVVALVADHW